jgi:hypothetical protein
MNNSTNNNSDFNAWLNNLINKLNSIPRDLRTPDYNDIKHVKPKDRKKIKEIYNTPPDPTLLSLFQSEEIRLETVRSRVVDILVKANKPTREQLEHEELMNHYMTSKSYRDF